MAFGWELCCSWASRRLSPEAESLLWRSQENKVDAEIRSWDLQKLLGEISAATGWQVFLEPDTQHTVSATFKDLRPGDALRLLLGDLNFALLPQSNAPAKFFIYRTSLLEATQLIAAAQDVKPPPRPSDLIPNELIVTLKPNAKETIDDIARKLGRKWWVEPMISKLTGCNLKMKLRPNPRARHWKPMTALRMWTAISRCMAQHGRKTGLELPMPFSATESQH